MLVCGYCRSCGRALVSFDNESRVCPACQPIGTSQLLAGLPTQAELALVSTLELEIVLRLQRLRRLVRAGVLAS